MNAVKLRDFPAKTLQQVSALIDKRTATIRQVALVTEFEYDKEELSNLLTFQTQIEYALQLVKDEEKTLLN